MEKPKKKRRSKEEIYLDNIAKGLAKDQRKFERLAKKEEKERIKAEKKAERDNPPTESELVHRYVNRVMNNQRNHGRVDEEKFKDLAYKKKVNKNLWRDNDFYFSVVFQSTEQKYNFLEKLGLTDDELMDALDARSLRVVNGLELAKKLGFELEEEEAGSYPLGNVDLMPFVLDNSDMSKE